MKKLNAKINIIAVVFLFSAFFLQSAKAEIIYHEDFSEKFQDFLLKQPILKTSFTGKVDADLKESYPFYASPLSNYSLALESKSQSFSPGETVALKGKLKFDFQGAERLKKDCPECKDVVIYPISEISEAGIFVQVWKKDENQSGALKSDFLIDEFYAASGLSLRENQEEAFNVNWNIPKLSSEGEYYFSFFINSAKRFNLKGNPLVPLSSAETFNFHLNGDKNAQGVILDKNNIKINGSEYAYRKPAPTLDEKNNVTITVPVENLNQKDQSAKISYDLLGWGQEDEKSLVLPGRTENVSLTSGEKKELVFSFTPDNINSVYNLKITASTLESKSIANVRFVLKGKNRGIIRFLGEVENQNGVIPMFCIKNAQWDGVFDGKLKLTALADGKELAALEKSGDFTVEDHCFVVTNPEFSFKNTQGLTLRAEVLNKDNIKVDERTVAFSPSPKKIVNQSEDIVSGGGIISDGGKIILLLVALMLIITGFLIYRHINNNQTYEKK